MGFKERVGNHRFSRTISAHHPKATRCDWLAGRCNHRSDCPPHRARRLNQPFGTPSRPMTVPARHSPKRSEEHPGRRAHRPATKPHEAPNEKSAPLPQAQWTLTSARCHGTARRRCLDPPIDAPRRPYPTCVGPPWRARPRPTRHDATPPCHHDEAGTTSHSLPQPTRQKPCGFHHLAQPALPHAVCALLSLGLRQAPCRVQSCDLPPRVSSRECCHPRGHDPCAMV